MNVCFVYKEDYPWDVRVEKIINTLISDGHQVSLVCKNIQQRAPVEHLNQLSIFRLPRTTKWPKAFQSLINLALWFNPVWLYMIYKTAKKTAATHIIIRDLPLMLSGIIVARLLNTKILFDMAECYPEMYRSAAQFDKVSLANKILKSPAIAGRYEKFCVAHSDQVLVMIEESRDRLLAMGFSSEKISIVSNTPILPSEPLKVHTHAGTELRIVYVGFVTKIRGIDLLIRAVREFLDNPNGGTQIQVDIIGKGSAKDFLSALVVELNLQKFVRVHGWLEHADAQFIMANANVGALTYRVCSHWNNTIPNKIFDYMASGLPVLATNVTPIARILQNEDCGLVSTDQDIKAIANNLIRLKDANLRSHLGENGRTAVINKYNWSKETPVLIATMKKSTK